MSFISTIQGYLSSIFAPFLGPLRGLWNLLLTFKNHITNIHSNGQDVIDTAVEIVNELKNFRSSPHFKSRVVNLPRALAGIQETWQSVIGIGTAVKQLWENVKSQINPDEAPDFATEDIEGLDDLTTGISKLGGRLAAVGTKLLAWAGIVIGALSHIADALQSIDDLLNDILTLVQDADRLNGIFLQQQNKRKPTKLADGKKISLRLGKLHR